MNAVDKFFIWVGVFFVILILLGFVGAKLGFFSASKVDLKTGKKTTLFGKPDDD